jgi:hypothetical protein
VLGVVVGGSDHPPQRIPPAKGAIYVTSDL